MYICQCENCKRYFEHKNKRELTCHHCKVDSLESRLKWAEDLVSRAKDIIHQGRAGGPKWLEDYEKGPVE